MPCQECPNWRRGGKRPPRYGFVRPGCRTSPSPDRQCHVPGRLRTVGHRCRQGRREVDLTRAGDAAAPGSLGHALMGAATPPVTRRKRAMSAVPSESPRTSADLTEHTTEHSGPESQAGNTGTDFGPNEWLVDELYQRYLADPSSVAMEWWNFFADYRPPPGSPPQSAASPRATGPSPVPAAPAQATTMPAAPASAAQGNAAPGNAAPAQPPPDGKPAAEPASAAPAHDSTVARLRGAAARTADNMAASLTVPTATSVRAIPAKLLADNRIVINNHLARGRGGKVSFTHLIGFAVVHALRTMPEMNRSFTTVEGKPGVVTPEHVNLGLAIDVAGRDGSRQLLVPSIKAAEDMDFRQFWMAYEDIVRRARTGMLTIDDYAGTTITLTNPGTIGTEHSVPRLMAGQGCIVGVGAMEYPAAYQGAAEETMTRLAISKSVTLTST